MQFRQERISNAVIVGTVAFVLGLIPQCTAAMLALQTSETVIVLTAAYARVLFPLLTVYCLCQVWFGKLRPASKLHHFEGAVISQIFSDVFCNAIHMGASGAPASTIIGLVTVATFATGMPWYLHASWGVSAAMVHYGSQYTYAPETINSEAVIDVFRSLPLYALLGYACDLTMRQRFQERAHIERFSSQLDKVVSEFGRENVPGVALYPQTHQGHRIGGTTFERLQDTLRRAEAINQLLSSAEARQRMFLATMSHELRSPLTGMLGSLKLLAGTESLPQEAKDLVAWADASGNHLQSVVNDILDFSKMSAGTAFRLNPVKFRPTSLLRRTLALFSGQVETKGIILSSQSGNIRPSTVLFGDDTRITQILVNLLSNALKFTPVNGTITLRANIEDAEVQPLVNEQAKTTTIANGAVRPADVGPSAVGTSTDGDSEERDVFLVLSVQDSGIGMTPETQQQLFKPFMQADAGITRKFGGTGLGLAICAELAQLMGCPQIRVESEVRVVMILMPSTLTAQMHLLVGDCLEHLRHRMHI